MTNRDSIKERNRNAQRKHRASLTEEQREVINKKNREYKRKIRAENPEPNRESSRKWFYKNRECDNQKSRDHYYSNREELRKAARESYKLNPEPIKKASREWRASNPEKMRINNIRHMKKRKDMGWGWNPINKWFEECEGHHLHINENHSIGIYIPKELHQSIRHRWTNKDLMNKINDATFEWYNEQYNLGLFNGDNLW